MSETRLGPGQSESIAKLATALVAAQQEMGAAIKTAVNPHFKSRYVDLAGAWEACKSALLKHGLTVVQFPQSNGEAELITQLVHVSGEWIRGTYPLRPAKANDPQALGAAMTYARRYGLMAMVGLAPEDDDGNTASGRGSEPERPRNGGGNPSPRQVPANDTARASKDAIAAMLATAKLCGFKSKDEVRESLREMLQIDVKALSDLTPEQVERAAKFYEPLAATRRQQQEAASG